MFRFTSAFAFASTLASATATAALTIGCAYGAAYVEPTAVNTSPLPSGRGHGREVIVVGPFDDARDDKRRCGTKRNGVGLETADVVCNVPAGQWVADTLAARLTREGYRVLSAKAVPGPSTVVIHGSVKRLFIDTQATSLQADVVVDLVVTAASGFHAEKNVDVRVREPVMISPVDPFQAAAEHSTTNLALDMASAVGDLLEPHPELGAPGAS
jgi:hypothetical protein